LSRQQIAEREPLAPRSGSAGPAPSSRSDPGLSGARSTRRKKGLLRRTGIIGPAIGIAVLIVGIVAAVSYLMSPAGSGAGSLGALNALTHSNSIAALEAERQNLIMLNAAAGTLSTGSKPVMVNPRQVIAAASAAGGQSGSSGSGTTVSVPSVAPANPGSAEAIAQQLMPSYGFSVSGQYGCLYDLWMRESGWNVYAQNPASTAYGIPQALDGQMASVGADWRTNPVTQIKWGLGYIRERYGTPCGAWDHEESAGWY